MTGASRIAFADYVLDSNCDEAVLQAGVQSLWSELTAVVPPRPDQRTRQATEEVVHFST